MVNCRFVCFLYIFIASSYHFWKKCTGFWCFALDSMHLLYQKTSKNAVMIRFVNYSVDIIYISNYVQVHRLSNSLIIMPFWIVKKAVLADWTKHWTYSNHNYWSTKPTSSSSGRLLIGTTYQNLLRKKEGTKLTKSGFIPSFSFL